MNFKKPKFWDLNKPNIFSYFLFPFKIFIRLNNFLLNYFTKKKKKKIKTICIGNIYVGGTGKTPTTIKLYNLLKNLNYKVITAKKYYKSQKDEQVIIKEKTKAIIAKTRKKIIKHAIELKNELIIFDDGLKDKSINYDIKFVCFDNVNWIGNGQLLPSGPLREKLDSLRKYDAVFLKNGLNFDKIQSTIKNLNPSIEIFTTKYIATNLEKFNLSNNFICFCGLGNPDSFKSTLLSENFSIVDEVVFPDHYNYRDIDINNIIKKAKKLNAKIITTEKDYVKIKKNFKNDIDYLDIDLEILEEDKLINFLKLKLNEKY